MEKGSDRSINSRPSEKRESVRFLVGSIASQSYAVAVVWAGLGGESMAPEIGDAEIVTVLNELVEERPRRGFELLSNLVYDHQAASLPD